MDPLLKIEDLNIAFYKNKTAVSKTKNVSFEVNKGEILCIVGESGCGKSITAMSVLGLLPQNASITSGKILFQNKNLLEMSQKQLDEIRGKDISMIFQDVMNSLNPVLTIGYQLIESITKHLGYEKSKAKEHAISLLTRVGLKEASSVMKKFPHMLSGGMRQRVMIAMALANNPALLIADEPTTALDVTIQLQIIELLKGLQKDLGMSILLITHDMGVVAELADRVIVMYAGECVESSDVKTLFENPSHPYTKALLAAIPDASKDSSIELKSIPGSVPIDYDVISGCRFYDRCQFASSACKENQKMHEIEKEHFVRCMLFLNAKDE